MSLVLDASVIVSWLLDDEESDAELRGRCGNEAILVPAHWQAEVANALLAGERRMRASPFSGPVLEDLAAYLRAEVDVEGALCAFDRILPLARAHGLTVYDAIYLELAERRGSALATLDKALADAARSVGVKVLGLGTA